MLSFLLILVQLVKYGESWRAPLVGMSSSGIVKDEYLVTLKDPHSYRGSAGALGGHLEVKKEYHIGNWHAALVVADGPTVEALREDPQVVLVEVNHQGVMNKGLEGEDRMLYGRLSSVEAHGIEDYKVDQDGYIVQVKGGTAEMRTITNKLRASVLSSGHNMEIMKEFHVNGWQGLFVKMDSQTANILRSNPHVAFVERNQPVKMFSTEPSTTFTDRSPEYVEIVTETTTETTTMDKTSIRSSTSDETPTTEMGPCHKQSTADELWGLSRISEHNLTDYSSAVYEYSQDDDGQGVDVYIVDSGVFLEHEEFQGRAVWGMTATGVKDEGDHDLYGQGTHVASIVAGNHLGVAKNAAINAVKVLDNNGKGLISDIIEGIEWTVNKIKDKKKQSRSVVNLPAAGPDASVTLEKAVQSALDAGVIITIAAGNDSKDACETTPARTSGAIVVGASDINDDFASFSNFGPCVDIVAPGVNIFGASKANSNGIINLSGTSMSAAHVAGVVARYLSSLPTDVNPSPADARQYILDTSSKGYLKFPDIRYMSTPNRLIYKSCGLTVQDPSPSPDPSKVCQRQETGRTRWSLTRVSSKESPANYEKGEYHFGENDDGKYVDIYVLDTGVYLDHSDFEGRASWGFTAAGLTSEGNSDLQGHGTHVASLAAGKTFGIAKAADIISVKVLNQRGSGSVAWVIEGLQWVSSEIERRKNIVPRRKGSIVNLSLGLEGAAHSLEKVIQTMVQAGITFVAAAGNEKEDACSTSPGRMSSVITVGATDVYDHLASFSNHGSCIDILAPGDAITGASNSTSGRMISSGTSQAAPHVAGAVARYMSSFPEVGEIKTPEQVKAFIIDTATQNIIDVPSSYPSTPNLLLFAGCGEYISTPGDPSLAVQNCGQPLILCLSMLVIWMFCGIEGRLFQC